MTNGCMQITNTSLDPEQSRDSIQFEAWTETELKEHTFRSILELPKEREESFGSWTYSQNSPEASMSNLFKSAEVSSSRTLSHFKSKCPHVQSPSKVNLGPPSENLLLNRTGMNRDGSIEGFKTTSLLTLSRSGLSFRGIPGKRAKVDDNASASSSLSDRCDEACGSFPLQFPPTTANPANELNNMDKRCIDTNTGEETFACGARNARSNSHEELQSGALARWRSEQNIASLGLAIDEPTNDDNRRLFTPPPSQAPLSCSPPPIRPDHGNVPASDRTGNSSSQSYAAHRNETSIRRAIYQMSKSQN